MIGERLDPYIQTLAKQVRDLEEQIKELKRKSELKNLVSRELLNMLQIVRQIRALPAEKSSEFRDKKKVVNTILEELNK